MTVVPANGQFGPDVKGADPTSQPIPQTLLMCLAIGVGIMIFPGAIAQGFENEVAAMTDDNGLIGGGYLRWVDQEARC